MHTPSMCLRRVKTEKNVQEWWGEEVNSGPKRKRRLLDNQDISVQYTRLEIV